MKTHNIFEAALTKKQIKFLRRETIRLEGHNHWRYVMNISFPIDSTFYSYELISLFRWSFSNVPELLVINQRIVDYKNKLQQNRNKFA